MKLKNKDAQRIIEIVLAVGNLDDVKSLLNLNLDVNWIDIIDEKEKPYSLLEYLFNHVYVRIDESEKSKNEHVKIFWDLAKNNNFDIRKKVKNKNKNFLEELLFGFGTTGNVLKLNAHLLNHLVNENEVSKEEIKEIYLKDNNLHDLLYNWRVGGVRMSAFLKDIGIDEELTKYINENTWLYRGPFAIEKIKPVWSDDDFEKWVNYTTSLKNNDKSNHKTLAPYALIARDKNEVVMVDKDIENMDVLITQAHEYFDLSEVITNKNYVYIKSSHMMKIFSMLPESEKDLALDYIYDKSNRRNSKGLPKKTLEGVYYYYQGKILQEPNIENVINWGKCYISKSKKDDISHITNLFKEGKIPYPWKDDKWEENIFKKNNLKASFLSIIFKAVFESFDDNDKWEKEFNDINDFIFSVHFKMKKKYNLKLSDTFLALMFDNVLKIKFKNNNPSQNKYINSTLWHLMMLMDNHGVKRISSENKVRLFNEKKEDVRFDIFSQMAYHSKIEEAFSFYKKENTTSESNLFENIVFKQYLRLKGVSTNKPARVKIM